MVTMLRDNSPDQSRDKCRRELVRERNYDSSMSRTFREALINYLDKRGIGLAELSRKSGVSHEQLKKLRQRPAGTTNVDDAQRIASSLGLTLDRLLSEEAVRRDTVAVVGRVGAGARVPLVDAYEKGEGLYQVLRPPQLGDTSYVAVVVEGSSMEPAYEDGDLIFYNRETLGVPAEAVGRRCVCEDGQGYAWVKLVRRREGQPEGLFDLISFHADSPPIYDVPLKWASPIRMHLPSDLIVKIENSHSEQEIL